MKSKSFKQKIFAKFNTLEMIVIAVGAVAIPLRIEGILTQNIISAGILLIAIVAVGATSNKLFKLQEYTRFLQKEGALKILGVGLFLTLIASSIISPDPAHAVLFKAEKAITTAITTNVDSEVAGTLNKVIVSLLWVGRVVLLGILMNMGMKINEGRGQDKSWKELLQDPVIFIISIGVINQIATFLTVGAAGP
jgi:hypothetical protein